MLDGGIPIARKRTKAEARKRIDRVNLIPDSSGGISPRLDRTLGQLNFIEEAAKAGAKILVEFDPLDRLQDEGTTRLRQTANVLRDDEVVIPIATLADVINDPETVMNGDGTITRGTRKVLDTGREVIRRGAQFRRDLILPSLPTKRKRKKNGNDKKLSQAFKMANARYRTKSGKLRKGRTQADIARLAQRLRKKM